MHLAQLNAGFWLAEPDRRLLCVGIPSINRTSESFLAYTVATLTDKLTAEDRASIRLVVLVADRWPQRHLAYGQPWLARIADEVLVYGDGESSGENDDVYRTVPYNVYKEGPGRGTGRVENMRLDHSVLVETCRDYGSPYFALIEDDVVASADWFAKLKKGLDYIESRSSKSKKDWIYLRLFYSEIFMGWNKEEWLSYSQNVLMVYAVVLLAFLARTVRRKRLNCKSVVGGSTRFLALFMALVLGLWLPASITLYFVAGRVSTSRINPFTWSWHPAREMANYGCCAQGLVFPRRHLEGVLALLRRPPYAFAGDQMVEDYARDHGLAKWALEPSVLQHVGLRESSAGDRRAEVWNFSFERQQRKRRASHGSR
ncbi:hypothetical protein XA68_16695 [Ophiocordyceps unilateralis]|uniref:Uncharacterized protein n=1 Tax=Ophiocordyceps unilateralis TaxID=268505 RepID=A0A2A9P646_OPHUN|nr:hypothetical protein XA68_16695 [Ophiocordyceps unilateralis]